MLSEDGDRQRHRVLLEAGLEVCDPDTGESLGVLGDLSDKGMLLHGPHAYSSGASGWFELRMAGFESEEPAHVEAECAWARGPAGDPEGRAASGWRFTGRMNMAAQALLMASVGRLRRQDPPKGRQAG